MLTEKILNDIASEQYSYYIRQSAMHSDSYMRSVYQRDKDMAIYYNSKAEGIMVLMNSLGFIWNSKEKQFISFKSS